MAVGRTPASTPTTLVSFNNANGAQPTSLIADAHGDLFGTTFLGGTGDDGTVFEIAKTAHGYATTPTTLVNFNSTEGGLPLSGLIADAHGDLFGTTVINGENPDGTVFEITNSGFVAPAINGTTITANGSSYETITLGDGARDSVSANGSSHDTITLGNGAGDSVSANSSNHDKITLGDGAGDSVSAYGSYDTITLGDGDGDTVGAGSGSDIATNDTITLGNGDGDGVNGNFTFNTTIKLGNGDGDTVLAGRTLNDVITLGNGAGDTVHPGFGGGGATDKITLGDGAGDVVSGGVSSGIITLGNGAGVGRRRRATSGTR
jgi:hypothetical protein